MTNATLLVCRNGHVIADAGPYQADTGQICHECAAPAIAACPGCREPILCVPSRPDQEPGSEVPSTGVPISFAPRYCHCCGRPFPWTERVMSAVRTAIRELTALNPYERDQLRRSIDHIIRDTPQTRSAVLRINTVLARIEDKAAASLRELFESIASDGVKKQLRTSVAMGATGEDPA